MTEQEFFIKNGQKLKYKKGEILIRGGEEPDGIYFLQEGIVKMSTFFTNGSEITFNLFKPNAFFPMIWALAEINNSYDFCAITDIVVYKVSKKETLLFLQKENEIYLKLVKRIMMGFDGLLSTLPHLLSGSSVSRVASVLLLLARRFGEKGKDGLTLKIKVTHEDLAGMAALTRETVSITIEKFEKEKIIQQKNRQIIIKDNEKLSKLAE
jgi:CRP/FNR family cyclic AMP-dependent transcriptional regulator